MVPQRQSHVLRVLPHEPLLRDPIMGDQGDVPSRSTPKDGLTWELILRGRDRMRNVWSVAVHHVKSKEWQAAH